MIDDLVKRLRALFDYGTVHEAADYIEQLEERVEELESIQDCACAYDKPTDVCAFHKRLFDRITTVRRARIEKLEAALREIAEGYVTKWSLNTFTNMLDVAQILSEKIQIARKALGGKDG
jgi:hypothetical protein